MIGHAITRTTAPLAPNPRRPLNNLPKVVAFDLDDTLAPSKAAIPEPMADLVVRLLDVAEVCIISGAGFEQFDRQVLTRLPQTPALERLHIMPTCGARYYRWRDGSWQQIYAQNLSPAEKDRAASVLESGARALGLWETQTWGPVIEDRGSQVTFSALGQAAPHDAKADWDADGAKKERLRAYATERLPDLEVRSGGSTSVDVTMKGLDKAHGVRELCHAMGIDTSDVLFVGDRLDEGGNDYPVKAMGVPCVEVADWHETAATVESLLAELSAA